MSILRKRGWLEAAKFSLYVAGPICFAIYMMDANRVKSLMDKYAKISYENEAPPPRRSLRAKIDEARRQK